MKSLKKSLAKILLALSLSALICLSLVGCGLADSRDEIAKDVTDAYGSIESGVVGAYEEVEENAVSGFERICDGFIEKFFAKNGESVEEAKDRLEKNK